MAQFDANAFVGLADDLLAGLSGTPTISSNMDQAKVRSSIGRSYFGAYLITREKLVSLGRVTVTGYPEDHRNVVDALGGVGTDLGEKLHRLRVKRNKADYELDPRGFNLQAGRFWVNVAQDLVRDVAALT